MGQLLVGLVASVLVLAAGIGLYYGISLLVLFVVGRLFPLTGRRRKP
jgi:hypothetical protein